MQVACHLHRAARALAAEGIPVFPCRVGEKFPAFKNSFYNATTDLTIIDAWWSDAPYNIGVCPDDAGWLIVDVDTHKGGVADPSWPNTYAVETPRGGQHLYFSGSGPSTVEKLGKGLDTRGRGGYVLVPPSIIGGKPYRVVSAHDLAELPGSITARLETSTVAVRAVTDELDTAASVARARSLLADYVRRGFVAVEFRGGNNRTYGVACELLNLGLTADTACELLDEIWNPACVPPWDGTELRGIVEHASQYSQNEAGAWAVPPAAEAFGTAADWLAEASRQEQRRNRFLTVAEMAALPDPVWLVKDVLMEASTCLLVGAWRSYKSFLALDLALSIATGLSTCFGEQPARAGPTIYACLEGMVGIAKARRRAWMLGHSLEQDATVPFYLGPAPLVRDDTDCQAFLEDIKAICERPALIVIDTLSQTMAGLDETRDAGNFIKFSGDLARVTGASILVLHHFGHDRGKGARGGTVYPAGFDTYLEGEAKGERRVEVWVRKQKDAEERSAPFAMQGRKLGPALVFYPIDAREHNEAVAANDPFSWQSVGAALEALKARGRDNGITASVLAQQLFPAREGEPQNAYGARVAKASKQLGALAKNRLHAYCEQGPTTLLWFLPDHSPK